MMPVGFNASRGPWCTAAYELISARWPVPAQTLPTEVRSRAVDAPPSGTALHLVHSHRPAALVCKQAGQTPSRGYNAKITMQSYKFGMGWGGMNVLGRSLWG